MNTELDPATETKAAAGPERIWEIDFLRGVSIILMVGYHALFDLSELAGVRSLLGLPIDLAGSGWIVAQNFFAALFVILSGISSTLSHCNAKRALKILAVAAVVTAATYVFEPTSAIFFGILHCLAVSILMYALAFEKAGPIACAAAGALVIALTAARPAVLAGAAIRFDWLLPFGIHSPGFASYDYFPLLPWFGVFLGGAALGKSVYARRRSLLPRRPPATFINLAGRHSLLIYIVHQPVIMAVLYVAGLMK